MSKRRSFTQLTSMLSPRQEQPGPALSTPVGVQPVLDVPPTELEWFQQLVAAGMLPDNRSQVHLAGRVPYFLDDTTFLLDERHLPKPVRIKRLGTLPCGCAVDGKEVRYGGFCPVCNKERCSLHFENRCEICKAPCCYSCWTEYKGEIIHKSHVRIWHPVRVYSHWEFKWQNRS